MARYARGIHLIFLGLATRSVDRLTTGLFLRPCTQHLMCHDLYYNLYIKNPLNSQQAVSSTADLHTCLAVSVGPPHAALFTTKLLKLPYLNFVLGQFECFLARSPCRLTVR